MGYDKLKSQTIGYTLKEADKRINPLLRLHVPHKNIIHIDLKEIKKISIYLRDLTTFEFHRSKRQLNQTFTTSLM